MAQSSGVKYNITDELFNLDLREREFIFFLPLIKIMKIQK